MRTPLDAGFIDRLKAIPDAVVEALEHARGAARVALGGPLLERARVRAKKVEKKQDPPQNKQDPGQNNRDRGPK